MDRREAILARLQALASGITGVNMVFRNRTDVSASQRPAFVILDADENADDRIKGRGRKPSSPNMVSLLPEIQILVGETAATVGTKLNEFRRDFLIALFADASNGELGSLIGANGNVYYDGLSTDFARERNMSGEMTISLTIDYPFNVAELAAP